MLAAGSGGDDMHALILAAALAAAPAASTDKAQTDACKPPQTTRTASQGAQGPRKLTELPEARLTRLVIRTVGDCYVSEVRPAQGEWRYEPAGRKPEALLPTRPNPYVQPLR